MGSDCIYGEAIVDTGASTNLLSTKFEKYLTNTKPSKALIQGFEGNGEIKGSVFGVGHLYVLGNNPTRKGFQLSVNFDTVANLNSNLFSVSSLYYDHNFSILFHGRTHNSGICELYRETHNGSTQRVPIDYDRSRSAFMIRFILGKDRHEVIRHGHDIERRRNVSLAQNMRELSQPSICSQALTIRTITPSIAIARNVTFNQDREEDDHMARFDACTYIPTSFDDQKRALLIDDENMDLRTKHDKTKEEWSKIIQEDFENVILGAKAGMNSRERKMSEYELHKRHVL